MSGRPVGISRTEADTIVAVTEFGNVYTLKNATRYKGDDRSKLSRTDSPEHKKRRVDDDRMDE